jgi:hypothetical protein
VKQYSIDQIASGLMRVVRGGVSAALVAAWPACASGYASPVVTNEACSDYGGQTTDQVCPADTQPVDVQGGRKCCTVRGAVTIDQCKAMGGTLAFGPLGPAACPTGTSAGTLLLNSFEGGSCCWH